VSRKTSNSPGEHDKKKSPQRIDLDPKQTHAILERVKTALGDGDYQMSMVIENCTGFGH